MLGYRKNALTGVTREAINFVSENGLRYLAFLGIAVSAFMAIEFALGEGLISESWNFPFGSPIAIVSLILYSFGTALFAVPLHNFIILESTSYFPRHLDRLTVFASIEFILSIVAVTGIEMLVNSVLLTPDVYFAALILIFAVALGVLLITVMPHVAVTPANRLKLDVPLSLSKGHRWAIFARLLRVTFFFGLITIGGRRLVDAAGLQSSSDETIFGYYGPIAAEHLWSLSTALFYVTLASLIYVRLRERKNLATATQTLTEK